MLEGLQKAERTSYKILEISEAPARCFSFGGQMRDKDLEKLITQIKSCGQTIIDNADKIAGGYKWQAEGLDIFIRLASNEAPTIHVEHDFFPDNIDEIAIVVKTID